MVECQDAWVQVTQEEVLLVLGMDSNLLSSNILLGKDSKQHAPYQRDEYPPRWHDRGENGSPRQASAPQDGERRSRTTRAQNG